MMLIIRPYYESSTRYTYSYSIGLKPLDSLFLDGASVKKSLFEKVVKTYPVEAVFFFGHGIDESLIGHNNQRLITAGVNDKLLKDKIVITLACRSARILGYSMIEKGAKCFIGYAKDFLFMTKGYNPAKDEYAKDFMEVGIMPAKLILNGKSTREAYEETLKKYNELISKWSNIDSAEASLILSFLIHDKNYFMFIGKDARIELKKAPSYSIGERPNLGIITPILVGLLAFS